MPVNGSFLDSSGLSYLWSKLSDMFDSKLDLSPGIDIPSHANLDTYTEPGSYCVQNADTAATITNTPSTATGYYLLVIRTSTSSSVRLLQMAFPISDANNTLMWSRRYTKNGWTHTTSWNITRNGEDSVPTSGSSHYLTSGGIYNAIQAVKDLIAIEMDDGPKNILKLGFTSYTGTGVSCNNNGDGTITINITTKPSSTKVCIFALDSDRAATVDSRNTIPTGQYMVKATGNSNFRIQMYETEGTNTVNLLSETSWTDDVLATYSGSKPYVVFRILAAANTPVGSYTITPCCIPISKYNVSSATTKYTPQLPELYWAVRENSVYKISLGANDTADADTYKTPGAYVFSGSGSISNCITSAAPLRLEVKDVGGGDLMQVAYTNIAGSFATRTLVSGSWSSWYTYSGSLV